MFWSLQHFEEPREGMRAVIQKRARMDVPEHGSGPQIETGSRAGDDPGGGGFVRIRQIGNDWLV